MSLTLKIKDDLKQAMRKKDQTALMTLRSILTAFTNELVANKQTPQDTLDDQTALKVIQRLAKQRKDAITQFKNGGREDLAEKELAELAILETYLPQQMTPVEISDFIKVFIEKNGPFDKSSQGKLTGLVMKEIGDKADGSIVQSIIKNLLEQ